MIAHLHGACAKVAPIVSVTVGDRSDRSTWSIQFADDATEQQKAAAQLIVDTYDPNAPTVEQIVAERERRLSLGFNYDFGNGRGVHRIGTTKEDMAGWSEVSTYAGALIDRGDLTTQIPIATDTGTCLVTPPEWRAIEIAAAQFRQPLWTKSFALMAMNPIPASYQEDSWWS